MGMPGRAKIVSMSLSFKRIDDEMEPVDRLRGALRRGRCGFLYYC